MRIILLGRKSVVLVFRRLCFSLPEIDVGSEVGLLAKIEAEILKIRIEE